MFTYGQRNHKETTGKPNTLPKANSPITSSIAQLQRTIGNRAVGNMLSSPANAIQRVINVNVSDHTEDDGRSSHVHANVDGQTLPAGSNNPTVYPVGWDELSEKYEMGDQVRGHLWNGRLGGTGASSWNLTPLENSLNVNDMGAEEADAQASVNDGNTVDLVTDVTYNHSNDDEDAEYYYPSHIDLNWNAVDDDGDVVDGGNFNSDVALPTEKDPDWDPDDPDNLGHDDELSD